MVFITWEAVLSTKLWLTTLFLWTIKPLPVWSTIGNFLWLDSLFVEIRWKAYRKRWGNTSRGNDDFLWLIFFFSGLYCLGGYNIKTRYCIISYVCCLCFRFPFEHLIFTPNTSYYVPMFPLSSPNDLLFTPNLDTNMDLKIDRPAERQVFLWVGTKIQNNCRNYGAPN